MNSCYGCKKRQFICHKGCEDYLTWSVLKDVNKARVEEYRAKHTKYYKSRKTILSTHKR